MWWSCVLGLLCVSAHQAMANVIATQTPSSTSTVLNASVSIVCSISLKHAFGVTFIRRFDTADIVFLELNAGDIKGNFTAPSFNGRVHFSKAHGSDPAFVFTLTRLQADDTDLYYCKWIVFANKGVTRYTSNGTIIIVRKEVTSESDKVPKCHDDDIQGVILMALSISSIPLVLCILILSAVALCKRFAQKFTPSRSVVSPPPRRPLPPPPGCQTYSYLSVSPHISPEYLR